ncbi:hypothetical protein FHS21_005543 [Phyllobacterium trifolii]|uniref:Uncharacterized protein n=1 Tax=Phyllobacterium trifolii TaxID=300193 RepID=A0A839UK29_9HYPH|nr:hypothetical protein [Phyllobacterium trifolii]MBB3149092.1 hypothetical protein [Phyllobacterium trifolii]
MKQLNSAITIRKKHHVPGDIDSDIEWLKRLLKDLENIRDGIFPDQKELATFPKLENWVLSRRTVPCLLGTLVDPGTGNQTGHLTLDLWVHAPARAFARTFVNFYALGEPGPDQDGETY